MSHGWPFKIVRRDEALLRTLITWSNKCRKLMDSYNPIKMMHFTLVGTNLGYFPCFWRISSLFFPLFVNFNVCHIFSCRVLKNFQCSLPFKTFYTRSCRKLNIDVMQILSDVGVKKTGKKLAYFCFVRGKN